MANTCHKICSKHVPHVINNISRFMINLKVSIDFSWIIHRYVGIVHGKFEKPSVYFSRLPPGGSSLDDAT